MSDLLKFSEHILQESALVFMACVYIFRIYWFTRFKAGKERQAKTGLSNTTPRKGILYSWGNVGMPWAMESTRKHFFIYFQFVLFHLGVTAAILLSFVIPYGYGENPLPALLSLIFQIIIGAAFIVGVYRIIRRAIDVYMRAISTPDDYFSLLLLTVWFWFAFWATPNNLAAGEAVLMVYFMLTAFFLVYVPFSKISHYLYYPFTRYFGKSMGHRGVFPIVRG